MRITDVDTLAFTYTANTIQDIEGHAHPGPPREATQRILRMRTNDGQEGFSVGASAATVAHARQFLIGRSPFDRELINREMRWASRIHRSLYSDGNIAVIDLALWDLMGNATDMSVSRLIGRTRDRIPVYASTMCGDDFEGGLDSPEAYADLATNCQEFGYKALKLHTWMPPYDSSVERAIAACQAVRDRVGPDMRLMLDSHHNYTRGEALRLGRELEELDFYWFEEPMDEHNISAYRWLNEQLTIPVVGPEQAGGQVRTRAEWVLNRASDVLRYGPQQGGITAALRAVNLAEAFNIDLEITGWGPAQLQILGTMAFPGEYYEQGMLHPHLDFDRSVAWLARPIDPLLPDGTVEIPDLPGLGVQWDWEYINGKVAEVWS
jgi:L-alanine-DL-glutamate epimerase-like enolase superfamily enzyme